MMDGAVPKGVDPNTISDPAKLRILIANAKKHGRDDIVLAAQLRIAEIAGQEFPDPIEREFWQAVTCAEEFKTLENGKATRLSRTRQKHQRVGAKQCLADWANDPKTTEGFRILINARRPDLTGEAIVIRHGHLFDAATVESAKSKLLKHGIDPLTIA